MKFDSLQDRVVVLLGASSGIGKMAVTAFLQEGAKVALASRSQDEMEQHLQEIEADPAYSMIHTTDVSDYDQIKNLADAVLARFGKIDVWINNAGITIFGQVDSLEPEEISRVIDVNLKGQIYGSRVAIEVFKQQGYGNLINVSSVLGKGSAPLQSVYVASKHGIIGFSSVLREDLMQDAAFKNIEVSVVMPASIDTPLFKHAASKTRTAPKPIPPVYPPEVAVDTLISCAKSPKPEMVAGRVGKLMIWAYGIMPMLLEEYMGRLAIKQQFSDQPLRRGRGGNLFTPQRGTNREVGGFGTTELSLKNYAKTHPILFGISLAGPLLLLISFNIRGKKAQTIGLTVTDKANSSLTH